MDKKLSTMYDLCETVFRELEEANEKIRKAGGKVSAGDVTYLKELTETMENLKCTIAKLEAEENGYSGRYWDGNYYRNGMNEMSRESGRRMSNTRGLGSSYAKGYSRAEAKEEFIAEAYELMEKAPDEVIRKKFERFLNEM
jgi:hypothetical protein